MERLLFFGVLSLPVIILSWRTLSKPENHGFYRFFSWESILWLFVTNYTFWFDNPFSIKQLFSWIFLLISCYLVVAGIIRMKRAGKPGKFREDKTLFPFERTTELIDTGIFAYIRHPLYSSLIFLTWGIFLKHTAGILLPVAILSTAFLYLTARADEKECIHCFGDRYRIYMKRSKRFIPFII
jgi:protein-S-isoprenylcysteine O-methyltransferase Ste14